MHNVHVLVYFTGKLWIRTFAIFLRLFFFFLSLYYSSFVRTVAHTFFLQFDFLIYSYCEHFIETEPFVLSNTVVNFIKKKKMPSEKQADFLHFKENLIETGHKNKLQQVFIKHYAPNICLSIRQGHVHKTGP